MKNHILGFLVDCYASKRPIDDLVCFILESIPGTRFVASGAERGGKSTEDKMSYWFEWRHGSGETTNAPKPTKKEAIIHFINNLEN